MAFTRKRTLFFLSTLALGFSFPYLIDLAGHALEPKPSTAAPVPLGELSAAQRLELACSATQQVNAKLNRLDPDRPSFLGELSQYKKVRPELQELNRLVCGR